MTALRHQRSLIIRFTRSNNLFTLAILRETSTETSYYDSSISLSPLYQNQIMDLHVTMTSDLHLLFKRLHLVLAKLTVFRVVGIKLCLNPINKFFSPTVVQLKNNIPLKLTKVNLYFHFELIVLHYNSCLILTLLGPCSKTGEMKKFFQIQKKLKLIHS